MNTKTFIWSMMAFIIIMTILITKTFKDLREIEADIKKIDNDKEFIEEAFDNILRKQKQIEQNKKRTIW